jgi:hypothetical protein
MTKELWDGKRRKDQKKACQKDSLWVLCPLQAFSLRERVVSGQKKLLVDLVVPFCTLLMQALERDFYI